MSGSRGTNVKRVSSAEYESRLNDIATAAFYDRMLPEYEPFPVKETSAGTHLHGRDMTVDGWAYLAAAVIAHSLVEYLDTFMKLREMKREPTVIEKNKLMWIEKSLIKTSLGETAIIRLKNEIKRICLGDEYAIDWNLNSLRRQLSRHANTIGRTTKAVEA